MLTDEKVREIQKANPAWSQDYIREKAVEWDAAVRLWQNSGRDLSKIPILPVTKEYKKKVNVKPEEEKK